MNHTAIIAELAECLRAALPYLALSHQRPDLVRRCGVVLMAVDGMESKEHDAPPVPFLDVSATPDRRCSRPASQQRHGAGGDVI